MGQVTRMNLLCMVVILLSITPAITFECEKSEKHCYTSLNIEYAYTMIDSKFGPVYIKDSQLFYKNESGSNLHRLPADSIVTTADGYSQPRKLITANGSMPGPHIVIYANQTITIVVRNKIFNEEVTIHWHGIDQLGWPFMDGVSFVTQCPISPGQTFNYTFQPRFGGTYWYHSHVGNQRDYGLYGAFIVLRSDETKEDIGHVLMIGEWNHEYDSTTSMTAKLDEKSSPPQSVLINGKGQFAGNKAPLEEVEIVNANRGRKIRFRLIGIGSAAALLFGISGHRLDVIETDGFRVENKIVDKIIMYPAERYDFMVTVGDPGRYNITVDMLNGPELKHSGVTGLGYFSVHHNDVSTTTPPSINPRKTRILNCPFTTYPHRQSEVECIPVVDLTASPEAPTEFTARDSPVSVKPEQIFFLNFGFPTEGATINARRFKWPSVSAISQPSELEVCSDTECENGCHCTNSLYLQKGANVTMVLLNLGKGSFITHPIHMHGHTYKVIKMGLPGVDNMNRITTNTDIDCNDGLPYDESICSNAKWRDVSWYNDIPGANLENPVRKDTVVVPYKGYTVIRFQADNPGVWFMHCHIDRHMIEGMALMLNESFDDFNKLPDYTVPPDFPICHNYRNGEKTAVLQRQEAETPYGSTVNVPAIVLGVLLAIVLVALIILVYLWFRRSQYQHPQGMELEART